jgi:TonB family protein
MELVTSVLIERLQDPPGLRWMLWSSVGLHTAAAAMLLIVPQAWPERPDAAPQKIMTLSLGGGPGPQAGGQATLGGRPIQTTAPLPEPRRPDPVRPPAARTPEMTMPVPGVKTAARKPADEAPVKAAPDEARGRTPISGDQEQFGSAIAETGGQGFGGLSTGGGGTGGFLDVTDFCCPEYLGIMQKLILANWNSRQEVAGTTIMRFKIQRDGRLTDVALERSSGFVGLDLAAQRALLVTARLPPLPSAFADSALTVHLMFDYQR